jgi:hypothetical protein
LVWHLGASSVLPAFLYLGAVLAVSTRRLPNLLVLSSYPIALILLGPAAYIDGAWWPEMEVVTRELVPSGL